MLNLNFVKQKPSNRSQIKSITKKLETLLQTKQFGELQILVTEVQCFEPDCVPIETLIILLGENTRWSTKILKPVVEVTDEDLNLLEIPDTLPQVNTELSRKKSQQEDGREMSQPAPSHPQWVLGIKNIIDQHDDPRYSSELEYLRDYLQEKLRQSTLNLSTSKAPSTNSISSNPPPTVVKMKSTTPSSSSSNSSQITSAPQAIPPLVPKPSIPPVVSTSSRQPPIPPSQPLILTSKQDDNQKPRHQKGVRQRGCPCCDPDNLDNIVDRLLYFDAPP